jgi:hypothetical protein
MIAKGIQIKAGTSVVFGSKTTGRHRIKLMMRARKRRTKIKICFMSYPL